MTAATKPRIERKFPHCKVALAAYDASKPARDAAWDRIGTNADVDDCERAEREALRQVQDAFHKDTHDINSHDNCMRVDITFIRRMVAESET